ncbi:hypothetical protein niasHT_014676 [Heterodera trifolii]|uniref:Uncharacterized protein n=1 Tax=Heterodera trifolii TaxID=157864 RepID=A0ABD2LI05_9BILA
MAAPSIRLITTSKAPAATGYSQAVLLNNQTLYISGQTGIAAGSTNVVPGGARAEAKQAMTNIGEILTYAGSSFKHVINCNIMVTNMNDFQDVNETFKNFFTADTYPARSFFQGVENKAHGGFYFSLFLRWRFAEFPSDDSANASDGQRLSIRQ